MNIRLLFTTLLVGLCLSSCSKWDQSARKDRVASPGSTRNPSVPPGRDHSRKTLTLTLAKGITMKLTLIPAGKFIMGSPETERGRCKDEGPHRQVTISKPFYMGIYEVTQAQWCAVMGTEPWDGKILAKSGAGNAASYISWDDASKFCEMLSKKTGKQVTLPTEAQWEHACRAGTKTAYSFGDDQMELGDYAWDCINTFRNHELYPHAAGQKRRNAWGLYDMHGNVNEWCRDWYDDEFYANARNIDPENTTEAMAIVYRGGLWKVMVRVFRGGAWYGSPLGCRAASRDGDSSDCRDFIYGFRVVVAPGSGVDSGEASFAVLMKGATRILGQMPSDPGRIMGSQKVELAWALKAVRSALVYKPADRQALALKVKITTLLEGGGKALTLTLAKGVTMKLALIPAGKFIMGSPETERGRSKDEGPHHQVTISKPFYMGIYEVTQAQWRTVMGTEPWDAKIILAKSGAGNAASYISWDDASKFCEMLSKKTGKKVTLPSEAQWEYACRAGTKTGYSFGDDASKLGDYAWYDENTNRIDEKYAHAAGRKRRNAWGLYDMHGNVNEWCRDWYDEEFYANARNIDPENTTEPIRFVIRGLSWREPTRRVLRGGSWYEGPGYCRAASRHGGSSNFREFCYGFRVVVASGPGV